MFMSLCPCLCLHMFVCAHVQEVCECSSVYVHSHMYVHVHAHVGTCSCVGGCVCRDQRSTSCSFSGAIKILFLFLSYVCLFVVH